MMKEFQFTKSEVNPIATPVETSYDLFKQNDKIDFSCDATKYRSLVGKLLFAASTVVFNYGLCYSKVEELLVYADCACVSIPGDRKSIT
ncbi:Polyprotein [Candida maltosa Xu316]|uniref:Polyprotein n=1 Tax=Candida maltosa (strain Xu316) TaxID=1245528 RepID=M3K7S6_CANMX|nr:Polyprotein [Candida maltosa Xu316]